MRVQLATICIWIAPLVAYAQGGPGTITGAVRDLNGVPIAQATVYGIRSDDMKRRLTTVTESDGTFRLSNLSPGTYEVRAYKESEGYPDTFFAFFHAGNDKNWRSVRVETGRTTGHIILLLGPKYAKLKLLIVDQSGNSVGAGIWFMKGQDIRRIYGIGVAPDAELLVPPVPFRFEIEKEGYELWRSKPISLRSGQTLFVHIQLKRS